MGTTTTLELSVSLVYIFSSRSAVDAGSSALCRRGAREHAPRILYIVATSKEDFLIPFDGSLISLSNSLYQNFFNGLM